MSRWNWKSLLSMLSHLRNLVQFAFVSGVGLALDFGIFLGLVTLGYSPFIANVLGASCAVVFVYFVSVYRIFSYSGKFLLSPFFVYLIYQILAIAAASGAVAYLSSHYLPPAVAKVAILPITFGTNYLFMWLLTRKMCSPSSSGTSKQETRPHA